MSVEVTGTLQQEASRARRLPAVEEVRDGLWALAIPIPDNPLGYSYCYVLTGDDVVLIDPGWDADLTWDVLTAGLHDVGTDVQEVAAVVLTHTHPDHHGLSGRVREASGAWIGMHEAEWEFMRMRSGASSDGDLRWLHCCGVPAPWDDELRLRADQFDRIRAMAHPDVLLSDGQRLGSGSVIEVVATPGHSPGHVCFAIAGVGVVLTGDHVLPRISPNVGAGPFTTAPPLGSYLDSLEVVSRFDDYEALPGHEYRFRGLTERSRAIAAHHDERTAELEDAVRRLGRATTWTVASSVSWARGWEGLPQIARRSALAESAAHLMALRESGRVAMSSDVDGDWWECLAGAQD